MTAYQTADAFIYMVYILGFFGVLALAEWACMGIAWVLRRMEGEEI